MRQLGVVSQLAGTINVNVRYPSVIKRELRGFRQRVLIARLLPQLNRCDAICVGGGALLADSNLHFPQSLSAIAWAARVLGKPLLCVGCSAEGEWSRRGGGMVHDFALRCDFIAVRDSETAKRFSKLLMRPVEVFGDFALPLSVPANRAPRHGIGLNVSQLPPQWLKYEQQHEDALVKLIRLAAAPGAEKIIIFTTGNAHDTAPAKRVVKALAEFGPEVFFPASLQQLRTFIQARYAVVATRLHAAIIALAEGVPAIGFSSTPKIGNFFSTLGMRNYGFQLADNAAIAQAAQLLKDRQVVQLQHELLDFSPLREGRRAAQEFLLRLGRDIERRETA